MSESVRTATKDLHTELEDLPFNKKLFAGTLTPAERKAYLIVHHLIFSELDKHVHVDIKRSALIDKDIMSIDTPTKVPKIVTLYTDYLASEVCYIEPHIYLNYMGLMFGGQIMKKRYPDTSNIYDFNNITEHREYIREHIVEDTEKFIEEVKQGFRFHIQISKELGYNFGIE